MILNVAHTPAVEVDPRPSRCRRCRCEPDSVRSAPASAASQSGRRQRAVQHRVAVGDRRHAQHGRRQRHRPLHLHADLACHGRPSLRLTASQAGLIASANYLGYLLGALFAARRWPARLASSLVARCARHQCDLHRGHGALAAAADAHGGAAFHQRLLSRGGDRHGHRAGGRLPYHQRASSYLGPCPLRRSRHRHRGVGAHRRRPALRWACAGTRCGSAPASRRCAAPALVAATDPRMPTALPQPVCRHAFGPVSPRSAARFRMLIAANTLSALGYVITATFIVALVRSSEQLQTLEASIWVVFGLAAAPSVALWLWRGPTHRRVPRLRAGMPRSRRSACCPACCGSQAIGTLVAALCVGGSFMGPTALGMLARTPPDRR